MPKLPPQTQQIIPYLSYRNATGAIEFLARAFGFEVRSVMPGEGDAVMHAELGLGDAMVYLGTPNDYDPRRALRDRHSSVLVYVDDVDAHFAHARASGAKIAMEPTDMFWGDRIYHASDPEGQHWMFHTHVRDVTPEEMQAAMASMPPPPPPAKRRAAKPAKVRARKRGATKRAAPNRKAAKKK